MVVHLVRYSLDTQFNETFHQVVRHQGRVFLSERRKICPLTDKERKQIVCHLLQSDTPSGFKRTERWTILPLEIPHTPNACRVDFELVDEEVPVAVGG